MIWRNASRAASVGIVTLRSGSAHVRELTLVHPLVRLFESPLSEPRQDMLLDDPTEVLPGKQHRPEQRHGPPVPCEECYAQQHGGKGD